MKKTKTKKDGAIKGSGRSGPAKQVQPEQPEPNSGHSRSYKGTKCGLVQRPEEVAVQRPAIRKIERQIGDVEANHTAWLDYIKQLRTAAEKANEASIYQTVTEAPDNLGQPHNALDDLVTAKMNLELHLSRALSPSGSVPTGKATPAQQPQPPFPINAIQLPRLQIPKFDGQYRKWPQFWATFLHIVDSQPLAEIEKLSYLLSYLEGKALEAVGGFIVAPENYEAVKATLQQRFGR
ncbi:unnamed protein product [Toxocara canis]|uniref:Gag protein n=1 Tax=Toxocara canis TaxID=6265 RepID=A0A183U3L8_TOXCA|nr:unnamed protein product [Toxocara canis]